MEYTSKYPKLTCVNVQLNMFHVLAVQQVSRNVWFSACSHLFGPSPVAGLHL